MNKWILSLGATAGALVAVWALWLQLGGAVPASQDFVTTRVHHLETQDKKLFKQSAKQGAELYRQKLRGLMIMPVPMDPEQKVIWNEILGETRKKQRFYEDELLRIREKK